MGFPPPICRHGAVEVKKCLIPCRIWSSTCTSNLVMASSLLHQRLPCYTITQHEHLWKLVWGCSFTSLDHKFTVFTVSFLTQFLHIALCMLNFLGLQSVLKGLLATSALAIRNICVLPDKCESLESQQLRSTQLGFKQHVFKKVYCTV